MAPQAEGEAASEVDGADDLIEPWREYMRSEAGIGRPKQDEETARQESRTREIRVPLTAGAGYEFRAGHRTLFPEVVTREGETDQRAAFRVASERRSAGIESFSDGTVWGAQLAVDAWGQGLLALQRLRNLKKHQPPQATTLPTRVAEESGAGATAGGADFVPGVDPTDWEVDNLSFTLRLNIAQGLLKLKEYEFCVSYCEAALEINPSSTKALWRKANAVWGMRNPGEARECLYNLLAYEPGNLAAKSLLRKIDLEEEKKRAKRVGPRPNQRGKLQAVASSFAGDAGGEEAAQDEVSEVDSEDNAEDDEDLRSWFACCRRRKLKSS